MKRKERKLFGIQAVLFGRDLLTRQVDAFDKVHASFGADGYRKIEDDKEKDETLNKSDSSDDDPLDDFDEINLEEGQQIHQKNVFDCLVIKKDSSWKGMFDILMLFVSCYNIFGNAYYSAFGAP